jgi:23S rRNA G2445 N2-methylase RlmL
LERFAQTELEALPGVVMQQVGSGRLTFEAPFARLFDILSGRVRTLDRLRIRLVKFPLIDHATVTARLARVPWSLWLPPAVDVQVEVREGASAFRAEADWRRALDGALVQNGCLPTPDADVARIELDVHHDRMTVWLDVVGLPLRWRGMAADDAWWVDGASLQETTAAALVQTTAEVFGTPADALWSDPFAGSGTVIREAERRLYGQPNEADAPWALRAGPAWREGAWRQARRDVEASAVPSPPALMASDASSTATGVAARNLHAGMEAGHLALKTADAREAVAQAVAEHGGPVVIVSNPPFGDRAEAQAAASADTLLAETLRAGAGAAFVLLYPRPEVVYAVPGVSVERHEAIQVRGRPLAILAGRVAP